MKKETNKNKGVTAPDKQSKMAFDKTNYLLIAAGIVILIIGFALMAGGGSSDPANVFTGDELFSFRRITLAPIVVIGGFAFIGYAIMKRPK